MILWRWLKNLYNILFNKKKGISFVESEIALDQDIESKFKLFISKNPNKDFFHFVMSEQLKIKIWSGNNHPITGKISMIQEESLFVTMDGTNELNIVNKLTMSNYKICKN